MALVEHEYAFDDSRVDRSTLLPETLDALDRYNFDYKLNPLGYFRRLESKAKSYYAEEAVALSGKRDGADMHYAKVDEAGCSSEEAIVWHNDWAQSVTPRTDAEGILEHIESDTGTGADSNSWNKLILADFMYFTLKHAGVRDDNGDTIPVLSIPSPSLDRRGFGVESKEGPLARLAIAGRDLCHTERLRSIYTGGVSQGAAVTAYLAGHSQDHFGRKNVFLGELPNASKRMLVPFGVSYMTDGGGIEGDYTEDGPAPRKKMIKGGENTHMLAQIAGNSNLLANLRLAKDMSRGEVAASIDGIAEAKIPLTLEYGDRSRISAAAPDMALRPMVSQLNKKGLLQILKAVNAPHIHSEHIAQTTDAMLRSVKFARS